MNKLNAFLCVTFMTATSACRTAATDTGAAQSEQPSSSVQSVAANPNFVDDARKKFEHYGMKPLPTTRDSSLPDSVKNFRVVVPGVLYRGGVSGTRGLNTAELTTLCEDGFSLAVYFYDVNFRGQTVKCKDKDGQDNTIDYVHYKTQDAYNPVGKKGLGDLMVGISNVVSKKKGPVFIHCHNGWHATGIAASIAARQFCGYDKTKVVGYLEETTDNNFDTIRSWGPGKVQKYKIDPNIEWDSATKKALCGELLDTESNF